MLSLCESPEIIVAMGLTYQSCGDMAPNLCENSCIESCITPTEIAIDVNINCQFQFYGIITTFTICYSPTIDFVNPSCQEISTVPGELSIANTEWLFPQTGFYHIHSISWDDQNNDGIYDPAVDGSNTPTDDVVCIQLLDMSLDVADVTVSPSAPYCPGQTITVSLNNVNNFDGVSWSLNGTTQNDCSDANPSNPVEDCTVFEFTPTTPGTYLVGLTTWLQGTIYGVNCESEGSLTIPIVVDEIQATINGSTTICPGQSTTLTVSPAFAAYQ